MAIVLTAELRLQEDWLNPPFRHPSIRGGEAWERIQHELNGREDGREKSQRVEVILKHGTEVLRYSSLNAFVSSWCRRRGLRRDSPV
jgi:hypothetical protein